MRGEHIGRHKGKNGVLNRRLMKIARSTLRSGVILGESRCCCSRGTQALKPRDLELVHESSIGLT
jgi:hypothetical protein